MSQIKEPICFYSDAAEWGGQEILSARIANTLSDVADILFFHFCRKFQKALNPRIQTVCLPFSASTPFPIIRDRSRKKQKIVEKLFLDHHVKNLVVCPGNIERCLPAILAAHHLGIRVVSYYPMAFTQGESGAPLGKIRDFLAKSIYPMISEWIVISKTQERLLRRFIEKKIPVHLLPNPLSWESIDSPRIPKMPLRIATIGRIYFTQKGQEAIPAIAQKLKQQQVPFSFRIIGDGPHRKTLKSLIERYHVKEAVQISDWISTDALRTMMKDQFDLIFIPSHFEGEPLILFESMQSGLPVLVADREYVKEYKLPVWMTYRPYDLSDAVSKIRDLPKNYNREDFIKTRERLFTNRFHAEFSRTVHKIFAEIFQNTSDE